MRTRTTSSDSKSSASRSFFAKSTESASPFFSPSSAGGAPAIQTKLKIGAPNDRFEQEADSVADRVVQRMSSGNISEGEPEAIQTKCRECEEKEKPQRQVDEPEQGIQRQAEEEEEEIQRETESEETEADIRRQQDESDEGTISTRNDGAGTASGGAAQAAKAVSSGGRPMTSSERASFEPHFGRDFSGVRLHDSPQAGAAAKRINAKAYTLGNNIAFAPGQYSPGSKQGQHLIAHELTHVVQQGAANTIRRAAPKPTPLPSTMPTVGSGDFTVDEAAESGLTQINFARNSKALTKSGRVALEALKKTAPTSVRVIGHFSLDEAATLANERAQVVKAALEKAPTTITVTSATGNTTPDDSSPDITEARGVEIVKVGMKPKKKDCKLKDPITNALKHPPTQSCAAMDPATDKDFKAAWAIAKDAMERADKSVKKTKANPTGKPSGDAAKLIDRFFGKHDAATLAALRRNLGKLKMQIDALDKLLNCGGQCDNQCAGGGAIAHTNGQVDQHARITLCVPAFRDMETNDQARNLIHETAHATTPLGGPTRPREGTKDLAYRHERMLFSLSTADRLRNSDSYALFAMFIREEEVTGKAGAEPAHIDTPEELDITPFGSTEQPALTHAFATLEKRLTWTTSWVHSLFGQAVKVRDGGVYEAWARNLMAQAAKRFPLTKPSSKPTNTDLIRIAAILARYESMLRGVAQPLGVSRKATGVVTWPAGSQSLADSNVKIGPDFFKATKQHQVSLLLQALAAATGGVEAQFIPAYSTLAKWVHSQN